MARKKKNKSKVENLDVFSNHLVWPYVLLTLIGLLQVYSSSAIYASENYDSTLYFFKKQAVFVVLSLAWFFISFNIPHRLYAFFGGLAFIFSFVALSLTHIPSLGVTIGGASRWLNLPGGFRLEPSEFYKVTFAFFVYWLFFFREKKEDFNIAWPFFIMFLVSVALFIKQPDFGSVVLLTLSVLVVIFFWLRSLLPFVIIGLASLGGVIYFLSSESYRLQRVFTFLDPWRDPQGKGFQTIQSFVAFKKGGFFGEGLGMSQSKFFFLPEAHTDFTLAVFAEEFGFVGVFILISLFMFLTFQLLKRARRSEGDKKLLLTNYYLSLLFFFCFFINICVNIGLLPTKGLPLPFLSYGGSSLLSISFLMGFFASQSKNL